MKFDFTKNIELEPRWQKRYLYLRLGLYLIFIAAGIYMTYVLLFPSQIFAFDFSDPTSNNNTISNVSENANLLTFDVFSAENFSSAGVTLYPDTKTNPIDFRQDVIDVRKTYKAFSYPLSVQPASFPEGSLLQNGGNYFIISDGTLRKFSSFAVAQALGYTSRSFTDVTADELAYNQKGANIITSATYPDGALFLIAGNYYQLQNSNTLVPFLSTDAFKSHYVRYQAITKDGSFLSKYQVSQNQIGFADGTLLSFGGTVFIVSDNTIQAFDNPTTFVALGYDWNDIKPASEDEISFYQYQHTPLFTMSEAHPDGTIFSTDGKYYLIEKGQKEEINGADILKIYTRASAPIAIGNDSLKFQSVCSPQKGLWPFSSTYQCNLSIDNLATLPGNDYQFEVKGTVGNSLEKIKVNFKREINRSNLRGSLSNIWHNILSNFGHANFN